jgi:hypothetical protein
MGQRAPLFDAGVAQLARATKTNHGAGQVN